METRGAGKLKKHVRKKEDRNKSGLKNSLKTLLMTYYCQKVWLLKRRKILYIYTIIFPE
ncbi:MAG: hypothetical protein KAJ93_00600 [Methanosarcinales archaeon]|nr:hypothetical protein [Methanosarcinales archaeon]